MYLKVVILLLTAVNTYGLFADSSTIVELDSSNFDDLIKDSKFIWLVEFYAPSCEHCLKFAPEYRQTANALEGVIKVGAVNAEENPELTRQHDVPGYPTIKIYNSADEFSTIYEGKRSADALVSFIMVLIHNKANSRLTKLFDASVFKTGSSIELTEANFDDLVLNEKQKWLVAYYSPFCHQSKLLASHWQHIRSNMGVFLNVGALDATIHFSKASNSKIEGYPTIKFFPTGEKEVSSGITYAGKITTGDIVDWALARNTEGAGSSKLTEITNFNSLKNACNQKPLCIVTILPHILDCQSKCRNEYLDSLRNISDLHSNMFWGWVWSEAGAQPGIEDALKMDGLGYPTMAAVSIKKMKYSLLVGSFSFDGIDEFLRNLSFGRGDSSPIEVTEMPDIKTVEPWDGLDAFLPFDEEVIHGPYDGEGEDGFGTATATEPSDLTKEEL